MKLKVSTFKASGSRFALLAALAMPVTVTMPSAVHAQASAEQNFSIPAGPLSQALQAFSAATGVQLVYSSELVEGKQSAGVSGQMTRAEALARLLAGTGLSGSLSGNIATISGSADNGERVTGAVRVEGVQGSPYFGGAGVAVGVNGTNGSRDITATEGTKSFTSGALTVGSKVPQAMKDIPQSLSVLTSERMAQQNVTDLTTALKQLPGVTLTQGSASGSVSNTNLNNRFYSRGFEITSIQVDGGSPLSTQNGYQPQIDMAQYDHVELLRGATGILNGYGSPSGSINLVRKKPLDHAQFTLEAQAGSWSNYRIVADATSPLAFDGRLRGRLVTTFQNNRYFYDVAKDRKNMIYGILEMDVTPSTLLTGGMTYTRQNSTPWYGGLPRYTNGDDIGLPRSTSLAFPWNRWDFDTTEVFGSIEQKLGGDWTAKLNVTQNRQSTTRKVGYSQNSVTPSGQTPTNGNQGPLLQGEYIDTRSSQLSGEATVTGSFELFGQRQEITAGANRVVTNSGGQNTYDQLVQATFMPYQPFAGGPVYCNDFGLGPLLGTAFCPAGAIPIMGPPINVLNFNPNNPLYSEPRNPLPNSHSIVNRNISTGAYLNVRLTAFDRLHLIAGVRYSRYETDSDSRSLCTATTGFFAPTQCLGGKIGDAYKPNGYVPTHFKQQNFTFPPNVNLSFDITKQLTIYGGYTDIYLPQPTYFTSKLKPVDPITGSNIEFGAKWAAKNGRLNASIAAYRIHQQGFAIADGAFVYGGVTPEDIAKGIFGYFVASDGTRVPNGKLDATNQCCYKSDPNQTLESKGIDIDVTGELSRGWQVSANYTYSDTKRTGTSFSTSQQGLPFLSIQPKNLYKIWTSFDFGAAGRTGLLGNLTVSAGVNGQSSGFQAGLVCTAGVADPLTGAINCSNNAAFNFTVPAYAVASGRLDYRLSDTWSASVYIENLFDKTYYQSVGSSSAGNWYGTPRSVVATIRAKW